MVVLQATSETFPGAAFLMSAGFTCLTLIVAVYVHLSLKGERFSVVVGAEGGDQVALSRLPFIIVTIPKS